MGKHRLGFFAASFMCLAWLSPAVHAQSASAIAGVVRDNSGAVVPGVTSLIRWQSHWHVVRQSWPFFQNDFAGRIANRVMQTSNSVRECVVSSIRAVWYIAIYGVSALVLMAWADWRLAVPTALWVTGYVLFLAYFVPRMRDLAKASSEVRSHVMGRVVDSYTGDEAEADIDSLAEKYIGQTPYPWRKPGEQRITFVIEPTHVYHQDA